MKDNPFRLLDYYLCEDAHLFFGREEETGKMVGEILSTRLLVLFSPSGSGKTSLINAGVRPELEKMGYTTVYTRMEGEPQADVCKAAEKALGLETKTPDKGLYDFLVKAVKRTKKPMVIFLDQFEEFFIVFKDNETLRREFIAEVSKIKYDESLPVFLVFSLREDYFAKLHEFRAAIPSIFQDNATIHLEPFTYKAARRAIEEPLKQSGWSLQEGLTDRMLDDLKKMRKGRAGIDPMSLQMVCGALWQARRQDKDNVIDAAVYDACGGAEKALTRFVHDSLAKVPGRKQGLAVKIFEALKTPDNTKRYRSREDLLTQLKIKRTKRFFSLLNDLAKRGILRQEERGGTCWYEFRHDLMVPEVSDWIIHRKERRTRRRFVYAILPGIILAITLSIYFFIEYHTFYAVFSERQYPNQEEEIVIIRGFNPFKEQIETGFLKSDLKDYESEDRIKSIYKIGSWDKNDWTSLGELLKLYKYVILFAHIGQMKSAVEIGVRGLKDNNSSVRYQATQALGELGKAEPTVIHALIASLKDKESFVRNQAAKVLGRLGKAEPDVVRALLAEFRYIRDTDKRYLILDALEELDEADPMTGHTIMSMLLDKDKYIRVYAAFMLRMLRKSAPPFLHALLAALQDKYSVVRYAAAWALGALGKAEPAVLRALTVVLHDKDEKVRVYAAEALGELGKSEPDVVHTLIIAIRNKDWSIRSQAGEALVRFGKANQTVLQTFIFALQDKVPDVRSSAAETLGKLGKAEPRVLRALMAALRDKESSVRSKAALALVQLGKTELTVIRALMAALSAGDEYFLSNAIETLGKLGKARPSVLHALIAALQDKESSVRSKAALVLGKLGNAGPSVLHALISALQDEDEYVRNAAADALGKLGKATPEVLHVLLVTLKYDDEYVVQGCAAAALGKLGKADPEVLRTLIKALKHWDSFVISAAATALGELGKAEPELVRALLASLQDKDKDSDVRFSVAEALRQLGKANPEVKNFLIEFLKDQNSYTGEKAAISLGQLFRDKPEKVLLGYLQDKRSGQRIIGAYALAAKTHLSKQTLQEIDRLKGSDPRPWVRLGAWQAFDLLPEKKEKKETGK